MSEKKENPAQYALVSVCTERHTSLDRRMTGMEADIKEIKAILTGDREHPGLAQDMRDVKRTATAWYGVIRPIIITALTATVTYILARLVG